MNVSGCCLLTPGDAHWARVSLLTDTSNKKKPHLLLLLLLLLALEDFFFFLQTQSPGLPHDDSSDKGGSDSPRVRNRAPAQGRKED